MTTPEIRVGQVWDYKRDAGRSVTITGYEPEHPHRWDPERIVPGYVNVDRNTSRRKQAIAEATLRRDYRLAREALGV